jgi:hypothetical protein
LNDESTDKTVRPFGEVLAVLLRDNDFTTRTGNVNWKAFSEVVDGLHYETLRKAVVGDRRVTAYIAEACARVLRVRPSVFVEYELAELRRLLDPEAVGFEQAVKTFHSLRGRNSST